MTDSSQLEHFSLISILNRVSYFVLLEQQFSLLKQKKFCNCCSNVNFLKVCVNLLFSLFSFRNRSWNCFPLDTCRIQIFPVSVLFRSQICIIASYPYLLFRFLFKIMLSKYYSMDMVHSLDFHRIIFQYRSNGVAGIISPPVRLSIAICPMYISIRPGLNEWIRFFPKKVFHLAC